MLELDELFLGGGILLIGLCAAIGVAIAAYLLIRHLHRGVARFLVNSFGYPIAGYILTTTTYVAFDTYMPELLDIDTKYYTALVVLLGVWTVYRISMSAVEYHFPHEHHQPNKAEPILKFTLRVAIWGFGVMIILNTLEIDITPLLAGAGIAGIAVALAAQDILGNIFGGAALYVDAPFRVGDWVKVSGQFGEVLQIGPRSTRIKTLDAQLMTIPNSKIAGDAVINFSAPEEYMLIRLKIGIAEGSDVQLVKKTMMDAVDKVSAETPYLSHDERVEANFLSFGDSSLDFELVICAAKPLYYYAAIDAVNCEVDRLFRERNISTSCLKREIRIVNMPDQDR